MMYNNKLAVAIKSNGKVLREFGENVYVPFGSEYTILIKNLNSVRALVKVSIDSNDVGDGVEFVIPPNDSVELERFIKNGNMDKGNRFKFIERTESVEEHRGIDVEDGLIRVEYKFETPVNYMNLFDTYRDVCKSPEPWWGPYQPQVFYNSTGNPPHGGAQYTTCSTSGALRNFNSQNVGSVVDSWSVEQEAEANANDAGITVPGSVSEQKFQKAASFLTENESHVIVLKMLGETEDNKRVRKPVTVKAKPKCVTCGKKNKATAKFCTECGTSLTIV